MVDVSLSHRLADDVHGLTSDEIAALTALCLSARGHLAIAAAALRGLRSAGASGFGDLLDEIAATVHDDLSPLLDSAESAYDRQADREASAQRQAFSSRRERVA